METRLTLIIAFLMFSQFSKAQVVLPGIIVDSMIFEIRQGRSCDTLLSALKSKIEVLSAELLQTGKAVTLLEGKNAAQTFIIGEWQLRYDGMVESVVLLKQTFRAKIRKMWVWLGAVIITEAGIITVLLIVLI